MKDWILAQTSLEFLIGGYIGFVALGINKPDCPMDRRATVQRRPFWNSSKRPSLYPTVLITIVIDVVQEEESKITPLDKLSPRHTKRRKDALFSLLKEEAEEQKITTQLLGFLLHRENYIHNRAVAAIGLKLFHKKTICGGKAGCHGDLSYM